MRDAAFDDHLEHALAHEPEARLVRALVAAARTPGSEASFALEHALLDAALEVREASVSDAKLDWWAQEIERTIAGAASHPVSRAIARAAPPDAASLRGRVAAAAAVASIEAPQDPDALRAPFVAYARAMPGVGGDANAFALGTALLVLRLRRWPAFAQAARARVPLSLLARHGLGREAAAGDAPQAARLVASLVEALEPALESRRTLHGAHAARVVAARHVARAMRASPVRAAAGAARARPIALMAALWRVGRRDGAGADIVRTADTNRNEEPR